MCSLRLKGAARRRLAVRLWLLLPEPTRRLLCPLPAAVPPALLRPCLLLLLTLLLLLPPAGLQTLVLPLLFLLRP
jgi:hypothetical protein